MVRRRIAHICSLSTFLCFFTRDEEDWEMRWGDQAMIWRRGMKELASVLASVTTSRVSSWDPRSEGRFWLEMLRAVAQNRSQHGKCIVVCL